jgi:septal ring factor EnvC (AmiA/AmiB activator)
MNTEASSVNIQEPGWWMAALAAAGAFVGWRSKAAVDSYRLDNQDREMKALKDRIKSLESGTVSTASALATLTAEVASMGRTLGRIDARLDGKADK